VKGWGPNISGQTGSGTAAGNVPDPRSSILHLQPPMNADMTREGVKS
jgi:hypothetical protein